MKKLLLSFVALFMGLGSALADEVATLSFADKANRTVFNTSQQVWEQNGIILTNNKGASTSNVADYAKPARFYKSSQLIIECTSGNITKIEFDCNSASYATALVKSIEGQEPVANGDKVTVILDGTSKSFEVTTLSAQVRVDALTVTYSAGNEEEKPVVTSIALSEASEVQTEYYEGDFFNFNGLTVTATYEDNTTEDVTNSVVWSCTPAELTVETTSVTVKATYEGVSASKTYDVTVKTIANTPETAYTVEEAVAIIDAGKGLSTWVYVKGIVSKVESFDEKYGQITYWISTDGTENGQQFECYGGLNIGGEKFTSVDDLQTGLSVVVYGQLKKYKDTYEFNYKNELVSVATTGISDINASLHSADGKFVENGRVVIVKAGKKYNTAGQLQK